MNFINSFLPQTILLVVSMFITLFKDSWIANREKRKLAQIKCQKQTKKLQSIENYLTYKDQDEISKEDLLKLLK